MKVVVTGGHHTAAVPLIKTLQSVHTGIQVHWFGHKTSQKGNKNLTLEYQDITAMNLPFYDLKAGKFYKTYDIIRLLKIPFGFFQALYLLSRIKPKLIISFGGYLAPPTVLAGWLLRIPSVTHEQTVVAGYANKFVSKFAKKVFISWPQSAKYFEKEKVVLTGLPVRNEIYEASSNCFIVNDKLPTLYVTAGKSGSHKINILVEEILPELLEHMNVIHQCGDNSRFLDYTRLLQFQESLTKGPKTPAGKYFVKKFVLDNEIGEAFAKSSLLLARSGAHTITEILALKKPALLIPIPWVSHNEQSLNAKVVIDAGLGESLVETELSPQTLKQKLFYMVSNLDAYIIKDESIVNYIKSDSTDTMIREISEYL